MFSLQNFIGSFISLHSLRNTWSYHHMLQFNEYSQPVRIYLKLAVFPHALVRYFGHNFGLTGMSQMSCTVLIRKLILCPSVWCNATFLDIYPLSHCIPFSLSNSCVAGYAYGLQYIFYFWEFLLDGNLH